MSAVMGIDPGVKGGVVVLRKDGRVAFVRGMQPKMLEDDLILMLHHAAQSLKEENGRECFLEKVGYIPGDGPLGVFTFGRVYGILRGFLKARGIIIRDVYPAMWQARLECMSGGDKNVTKRRAAELFPEVRVNHVVADALLIAEYGRQVLSAWGEARGR